MVADQLQAECRGGSTVMFEWLPSRSYGMYTVAVNQMSRIYHPEDIARSMHVAALRFYEHTRV